MSQNQGSVCTSNDTDANKNVFSEYCVVLFKNNNEDREYAAIPTVWLCDEDKYCFWPENCRNIRKLIKDKCKPNEKFNFTKYEVIVIQKYDTYEKALLKERKLISTSSQTDDADADLGRSFRKRKASRFISNSDDTDSAPDNIKESFQIKSKKFNRSKHFQITKPISKQKREKLNKCMDDECDPDVYLNHISDSDDSSDLTPPPSVDQHESSPEASATSSKCSKALVQSKNQYDSLSATEPTTILSKIPPLSTDQHKSSPSSSTPGSSKSSMTYISSRSNRSRILLDDDTFSSPVTTRSSLTADDSNLARLLLENIIKVKNAVSRIEQKLSKNNIEDNNPSNTNITFEPIATLPIKTLNHLETVEKLITENNEANNQLMFILLHIGGNNIKQCMQRCLTKIFHNGCAMKCSLTGAKNNYPLKDLKLLKTIKDSVTKLFPTMTEIEFENNIKGWFRHAAQRFSRETKTPQQ